MTALAVEGRGGGGVRGERSGQYRVVRPGRCSQRNHPAATSSARALCTVRSLMAASVARVRTDAQHPWLLPLAWRWTSR
jgi:hypothetical protein